MHFPIYTAQLKTFALIYSALKTGVLGRLSALSLRQKISIIHTYHGHTLYGYFSKIIVKANIAIERILALKTDLFIADSTQVMSDLKKVKIGTKSDWIVIPPGIRPLKKISKSVARKKSVLITIYF